MKPIIVGSLDEVCDRLYEKGGLSPNSECMRLLRKCIHEYGGDDEMDATFTLLTTTLNKHPDRDMLISEIVGSWYYSNFSPTWDEYQQDLFTEETDPAFFLRYRREDTDDPLRLRKHRTAASVQRRQKTR